jgi:hypothetical protein
VTCDAFPLGISSLAWPNESNFQLGKEKRRPFICTVVPGGMTICVCPETNSRNRFLSVLAARVVFRHPPITCRNLVLHVLYSDMRTVCEVGAYYGMEKPLSGTAPRSVVPIDSVSHVDYRTVDVAAKRHSTFEILMEPADSCILPRESSTNGISWHRMGSRTVRQCTLYERELGWCDVISPAPSILTFDANWNLPKWRILVQHREKPVDAGEICQRADRVN